MGRSPAEKDEPAAEPAAAGLSIGDFDQTVHHPVRLGILTVLGSVERATFGYLRDTLSVTDGNLSRNLTVLEEAGLVGIDKGYDGKRPRTWVTSTPAGRAALAAELKALRTLSDWRPAEPA